MKNLIALSLILFVICSCSKDDNSEDSFPEVNSEYFFTGSFDGNQYAIEEGGFTVFTGYSEFDDGPNLCVASYGQALADFRGTSPERPEVQIAFNHVFVDDEGCDLWNIDTLFHGFFPVQKYDIQAPGDHEHVVNVTLTVFDSNSDQWSTENGHQTSSSYFILEDSEPAVPDQFGQEAQKVSGKLKCTVYHKDGSSKELEGRFVYKIFKS